MKKIKIRSQREIEQMISKLYSFVDANPDELPRIILYTDCLSWVLGEDYLDQYIEDLKKSDNKGENK